jgi:DNA mismatch endonuclease, patch repair protein
MTDSLSKAQRSRTMSKVRSADTKPEWILRCGLHRLGFRYRLGNKQLPGRPDLVFPKYRAAVFVHGCYWHRHPGCKDATTPKSNVPFWTKKFAENTERDGRVERELTGRGWRVTVVWECELIGETVETVRRVATWLREGAPAADRTRYHRPDVDRDALLAVAEKKVRYRLAAYDEKQGEGDSGADKV